MEKRTPESDPGAAATDRIKDSAQQIWLAGLGAFAKMQQEGSKAFEALVKDGAGVQKKTQQAAEETLAQAQARMAGFANEFGTKAAGGWGKLENIFEERVARALEKLGMPSAEDVAALRTRVDALEAELRRRDSETSRPARAAAAAAAPRKTAARKAPAEAAASKPSRRRARPGSEG
ncbi:phasin family protein [Variovorax sp. J22P168]|uniref:phasin family protein n=1 Tax=Variovorax jilinensis TaxID=3053513 RepID=UPI0025770B12|nr:phasin family protein [Variovorax sp. J22P168]MDM0011079.1 phasin family protein [Variovorax sp. J22P168]